MTTSQKEITYQAAQVCLREIISNLASAAVLLVDVQVDPGRPFSEIVEGPHQIKLTTGKGEEVVLIEHSWFIDEQLMRLYATPKLKAAIAKLAAD